MRCHEAAAALMEGHAPSGELRAHLDGCEDCRALAALHAAASALRPPSPPSLPPVSRDAVLREVRRRAIRRRAAAGAVASLCLGALLLWPRPPAPVPEGTAADPYHYIEGTPAPRPELGMARAPREDVFSEEDAERELPAERGSLLTLMGEVRGYTRRDLVVHDATYRPFGTLAAWLRPPDSRALETPPYGTAVLPVLYPQE
jgi:hypothetical protein